jgi:hypothetical protein
MSDHRGTLEALVNQLTSILSPLTGLTTLGAQALLPEPGLPVNDAQAASIAPVLTATTNDIGNLISLAQQLEDALICRRRVWPLYRFCDQSDCRNSVTASWSFDDNRRKPCVA